MRPQRYPNDLRLSWIVDLLMDVEEDLCVAGDAPNERRAQKARYLVLEIALGGKR